MKQNNALPIAEFFNYYPPIILSYSESFAVKVPSIEGILELLRQRSDLITLETLINYCEESIDIYLKSLLYRLIGVREIIYCRDNKLNLDISFVWDLISRSIRLLPGEYIISSIGSQGFLSIPLYKLDKSRQSFDFIRLHIWDDGLNKYMDLRKCEDFSIHSHTFFAKSWIITGKVINNRYEYIIDSENSDHSFFEVVYNNSLNEVNQHTSKAVNKKINAKLIKTSEEVYYGNGYYEIPPSKLHKSGHLNSPDCSATFFSFTGKDGLGESFVIGPKEIVESEVNRKMNIEPNFLLDKIDSQL